MVHLFAECDHCGAKVMVRLPPLLDGGTRDVRVTDSETRCSRCGGAANVLEGECDFVGGVLARFQRLSREQLELFQQVTSAAATGIISKEAAIVAARSIRPDLAHVVEVGFRYGIPSLLVVFATLYLNWIQLRSSDESSDDTLHALQAIQRTMQHQLELATANAGSAGKPTQQRSVFRTLDTIPGQHLSRTEGNRHERRAKSVADRRRPRSTS